MSLTASAGLLGRIAVHYKLVTPDQLEQAVRRQGHLHNPKRLGELLLEMGFISREQLQWLVAAQEQVLAQQKKEEEARQAQRQQAGAQRITLTPEPPQRPATQQGRVASQPTMLATSAAATVREAPTQAPTQAPTGSAAQQRSGPLSGAGGATQRVSPLADAPAPARERERPSPLAGQTVREAPSPSAQTIPADPARHTSPPTPAGRSGTTAPQSVHDVPPGDRALDRILAQGVKIGASDIHIHARAPIQMRLHGQLLQAKSGPIEPEEAERMVLEVLDAPQRERFLATNDLDFAYSIPGLGRFRANAYRQQRGIDAVFRVIPNEPPTLESLGLPRALARLTNYHQGLVLVTGPAGCGKSSTLAALVNLINEERRDHIITVEDPIEYLHPSKRCVVNQRQVVKHTETFAAALRAALREDPDVIAIGELRDLETVSLAITAAETGHLVLATLHTSNAIRTINRVLDVFPPKQQAQIRAMVSESLRAIVSQRLVPATDGARRVAALETLISNPAIANLIRDEKTFQIKSILQTGKAQGMGLLDDSLVELVKAGTITKEVARRQCEDPKLFT